MVSPLCLSGAALHGATPSVQQPPPSSSVWLFGATPHMRHYAVLADSTSLKCRHTSRQQDVHEQTQYGHEVYLLWWEARNGSLIEIYVHIVYVLVCARKVGPKIFRHKRYKKIYEFNLIIRYKMFIQNIKPEGIHKQMRRKPT